MASFAGPPSLAEAARPKKAAKPAKISRAVWTGVVAGPLSPREARILEDGLVEVVRTEERIAVVDVGGRPVSALAQRHLETEHRARYEAGIRALLAQDYELALRELDLAAELFERSLAGSRDHGPRFGSLVAKAAVLLETGRKEAARQVLVELAALEPGAAAPTRETQSEPLVTLYEEARDSLGRAGRLRFEGEMRETRLRLDGRDLGEPPFGAVPLAPGRHLLSIRTAAIQRVEVITIAPGEERTLRLPGEGPEERHRTAFLEEVTFRPARVADAARKIAKLAAADHVLVAWVRKTEGAPLLYLARLDASGRSETIGRGGIESEPGPRLRALVGAVLDPKRTGGFEVHEAGKLVAREGVAEALGERAGR